MAHYDSEYNTLRLKVIRHCSSRAKLGRHVAEFGCGAGAITPVLLDYADQVTGFDFDAQLLQAAREANSERNATYVLHNLDQRLGDEYDNCFDSAVALEIIEHLEDPEAFLDGVAGCLRPGGVLLVSTPNLTSPEAVVGRTWALRDGKPYEGWDHTHKNLFKAGLLLRLLRQRGFSPIRVVGYHYGTCKLPLLRARLRVPLKWATFWPLNRIGFNVLVTARIRPRNRRAKRGFESNAERG